MPSYFEPTNEDDLLLLDAGYRKSKELAWLAPIVEAEVIGHFTEDVGGAPSYRGLVPGTPLAQLQVAGRTYTPLADGRRGVFLRGYAIDAADAEAGLRKALARTIAVVLAWRLEQHSQRVHLVQSVSGQAAGGINSNVTYHHGARDPLPDGWQALLAVYDERSPVYGV